MSNDSNNPIPPITEDDIANYLANTPDFFQRHAQLLGAVQLTSPHGNRAVSLQERQAEMLREKIKVLEHRIMEMVRHGSENMLIADRILRWARNLFTVQSGRVLPAVLVAQLQNEFMVPQAALKIWDVDARYGTEPFAQGVSDDAKTFASSLTQPYCGVNSGFEAVGWLGDPATAMSLALIPLRAGPIQSSEPAFGMLVLASPDPQRFQSGMATDFLERLAELASAALSRIRPR
ncbi:DUF484 family protein [Ramlibacter sp.]|uniref:DUF484 family protein n=1 Tax=Ramlibacter sp. TaxID=1917967 RepID=UPI0018466EA0|nr:DUF484 family protein [Ramlibacter sp.]MBA2672830.1 DUF484 family protein [Ramlibacter sp.]